MEDVVWEEAWGREDEAESSFRRRKRLISVFRTWAWLDNSSLAAADSSAVAEFVWTTLEIWSMPVVTWTTDSAWIVEAAEI